MQRKFLAICAISAGALLAVALPSFASDDPTERIVVLLEKMDRTVSAIDARVTMIETKISTLDALSARITALEAKQVDPFAVSAQKPAPDCKCGPDCPCKKAVASAWQCGPNGCTLVPTGGYAPAPEARQFPGWVCVGKDATGSIWYQQVQTDYGSCASGSCGVASGGCASGSCGAGRGRRCR